MHLLEILHNNMGLITLCDINVFLAISLFDWLCDDVTYDINIPLAE